METIKKVESPLQTMKLEPASPEHKAQGLEVSAPEELLAPVKSEELYLESASDDPVCWEGGGLSYFKDEVLVKDEIEIGPTEIQTSTQIKQEIGDIIIEINNDQDLSNSRHIVPVRVQSQVEVAGISEAEFSGNYSRGVQEHQSNFVECSSNEMVQDDVTEIATPLNMFSISKNHLYTEETPSFYKGNICNKGICSEKYNRNGEVITKKKMFFCDLCNYKASQKANLIRHIIIHTGVKQFSCNLCTYKCSNKSNLTRHVRTHTGDKPFSCRLCNFKGIYKYNLIRHMRTHAGEKPFSCNLCNYKTCYKFNLNSHIRIHNGEKPFSCYICNYKCSRSNDLTRHIRTHTRGVQEHQFNFVECSSTKMVQGDVTEVATPLNMFSISKNLIITEETPSSFYKGNKCNNDICSEKCNRNSHVSTKKKSFFCDLCNYKASQKANLIRHIIIHTGDKQFSCNLCIYKCSNKSDLIRHIRTHTGDKPFSCRLCNFKGINKYNLTRHMRTHAGEKPFSCNLCNYKTCYKFNLNSHIRIHNGEKPFSCYLCNYKCSRSNDLTRHIRTHTGEKPFSCDLCNYKSTEKSYLTRHIRRTH